MLSLTLRTFPPTVRRRRPGSAFAGACRPVRPLPARSDLLGLVGIESFGVLVLMARREGMARRDPGAGRVVFGAGDTGTGSDSEGVGSARRCPPIPPKVGSNTAESVHH